MAEVIRRQSDDARSVADRWAAGQAQQRLTPLEAHAELTLADGRDPVGLLAGQAATRVPDLVPVRHGRMLSSPFAFFRGGALIMAADLAGTPTSGLRVQLCGDAHLSNFGAYASRERRLVFDVNDFDETLPGPFEWDVKRLAASFVIAAEANGFDAEVAREAALIATRRYRVAIRALARRPILDVWYTYLDVDDAFDAFIASLPTKRHKKFRREIKQLRSSLAKARTKTSLQAIRKLTTVVDGHRRIVADPPLIMALEDVGFVDFEQARAQAPRLVEAYRRSLPDNRRRLLDHFRLQDVAFKAVGVGSVGTRAWVLLLEGASEDEAIMLQAKQAEASVLAPYAGPSEYEHEGRRVVEGQRLTQATTDIFLGWIRNQRPDGRWYDYYIRQLRDWKLSLEIADLGPEALILYAQLCGGTLARAHARTGDRMAIAGYLGKSPVFEHAVADFAERYARRNELDHALLAAAVDEGLLTATLGV